MTGAHSSMAANLFSAAFRRGFAADRRPANDNRLLAKETSRATAAERSRDRADSPVGGAVVSFLAAGAVLFASLLIGSSGSLLITGSDAMVTAIEQAFLSLGLRAVGVALVAFAVCLAVSAGWRRHHGRNA